MPRHKPSARIEIAEQVAEWQRKKNDPTEWHVTKPRRETHGRRKWWRVQIK